MNYGNMCNNCDSCFTHEMTMNSYPYACCAAMVPAQEPLYPADPSKSGHRRVTKVPKKCCATTTKVANLKKKTISKSPAASCSDICKEPKPSKKCPPLCPSIKQSCAEPRENQRSIRKSINRQEEEGCCGNYDSDSKEKRISEKKSISDKGSCATMATNQSCEKSMKNYMYDNPELKDAKASKGCVDIEDEYGSDTDIWIVQCPKDFDPCKLMNTELSKAGKQSMEICTNRFSEKKTLAVIAPEKAAEYELICDKLKLVKPIGKIVLCEKFAVDSISSMRKSVAEKKSSKRQYQDDCSPSEDSQKCDSDDTQSSNDDSCEESEEDVRKPLANNKLQKKVDEQKFTIETTVTVEKCGQKKQKKCLPIVPPEPTPFKNKRKSKNSDELNWMKC